MDTGPFAVIPSVVILGPVALLTLLLSALFGRIHSGLRRWSVVSAVAASDAILYLFISPFANSGGIPGPEASSPSG
jgi:hypothetical protein